MPKHSPYDAERINAALKETVDTTGKWPGWKYTKAVLEHKGPKNKAPDPKDYINGEYGHLIQR